MTLREYLKTNKGVIITGRMISDYELDLEVIIETDGIKEIIKFK